MIFNYGGGSNGATVLWGANKLKAKKIKLKIWMGDGYCGTKGSAASYNTVFCDGKRHIGKTRSGGASVVLYDPSTSTISYHHFDTSDSGEKFMDYSHIYSNLYAKKTAITAYDYVDGNYEVPYLWYINPDFEFSYVVKFPQTIYYSDSGNGWKMSMYFDSVNVCPLDDGKSIGYAGDKYTSADFGTDPVTNLGKDVVFIVDGTSITDILYGTGASGTLVDFLFIGDDVFLSFTSGVYKIDIKSGTCTLIKKNSYSILQSIGRGVMYYSAYGSPTTSLYTVDENWEGTKIGTINESLTFGKCDLNGLVIGSSSKYHIFSYALVDENNNVIGL